MDEESKRLTNRSPVFHHLYRRLRYQGAAQWITLLLIVSCIGLFMLTTPLNSYVYRRGQFAGRTGDSLDEQSDINNSLDGGKEALSDSMDSINDEEPAVFSGPGFWDGVDWDDPLEVPERYTKKLSELEVENGEEDVEVASPNGDLQVFTTFFQETIPKGKSKGDILLLHSSQYHSDTWVKLDTLKILTAMGYRAVAIDLPGFGNSRGSVLMGHRAVTFIENFLEAHGLKTPMIIAPAMAGGYAFPFIMSVPHKAKALIAISPTTFEAYSDENYRSLKVPLLLLFGSRETIAFRSTEKLLRNSTSALVKVVPSTRQQHAIYVDQTDEFHRLMYVVIRRLEAYDAKLAKENINTTVHPPVVTHNAAETLPPEFIMNIRGGAEPEQLSASNNETWSDWFEQMRKKYGVDQHGKLTIPLADLSNKPSPQQKLQVGQPNPGVIPRQSLDPKNSQNIASNANLDSQGTNVVSSPKLQSLPSVRKLVQNDLKIDQTGAKVTNTISSQREFDKIQKLAAVESQKLGPPSLNAQQAKNQPVKNWLSGQQEPHSIERPAASVVRNIPNVSPEMMRQQQFMAGYPEGMDEQAFLKAQSDAAMKSVGEAKVDETPAPYFVQRPGSAADSKKQSDQGDKSGQQFTQFAQQPQVSPLVPPQTAE